MWGKLRRSPGPCPAPRWWRSTATTLRRSHDRAGGGKATHIVSAYANASSLVLG